MKKFYSAFFLLGFATIVHAQTYIPEQYASTVIAVSSEYNSTPGGNYNSQKLLGAPDVYPLCGSYPNAWAPNTENGSREFFVLGFATPQPVNTIRIYQTWGPGAVDTVYLRNAATGIFSKVWETSAVNQAACPGTASMLLEITIPTTGYNVDAIRVAINSPLNTNWNEFDAVGILNRDIMSFEWIQNASTVLSFSSQYSTTSWSAQKILGAPNVYPSCADNAEAWCPSTQDGMREFIEVSYAFPAPANQVTVYQTYFPGAVDTVYVRAVGSSTWVKVFERTAAAVICGYSRIEINFTETPFDVAAVRVTMNSPLVPSWNELDAITLQTKLPPNAKFSTASGNWSNSANWSGGIAPTANDTVVIGNGHNITLDANAFAETLMINVNGTLTVNSGSTLEIGPDGGGNQLLQVQGSLVLSNGTIEVNGNADFQSGSTLNMTGGNLVIDGNDGTDPGSVANGIDLLNFRSGMTSLTFTGGTITIVDPQYHLTGQAITGNYTFGIGSTVRFGNATSTAFGNNSQGFGGSAPFPIVGNFMLDASTFAGNRHFRNDANFTVLNNATIAPNNRLDSYNNFYVTGNLTNNGTILQGGYVRVNNLINQGNVNGGSSTFTIVNDLINNIGASVNITGYVRVGNNVQNNGSLTTGWLYFAGESGASPNPQTIGGSGTFSILGLDILNSNAAGVTLQIPLSVQSLYFEQGKLFLGNNDLTVTTGTYPGAGNPGTNSYLVINGTGRLIHSGLTNARIFPIGTTTSYTPVTVGNGNGHTFSASVSNTFTSPPYNSSVVQREWNINDLTGGAVSADMTFQWNAGDEDPSFNRSICLVGRHNGTAWQPLQGPGPASGTGPYTRTVNGVTTFSPFAVGSNNALPIKLQWFTASKSGNTVQLKWLSSEEINALHYEVQRSRDGVRFEKFNTVAARNSGTDQLYETKDNNAGNGVNYYRLKLVDQNGKFDYSKVVKVDMGRRFTVFIYPNPARKYVRVQGATNLESIQLFDMSGRLIKEWSKLKSEELDLQNVMPGVYQLRLKTGSELYTERIVISR